MTNQFPAVNIMEDRVLQAPPYNKSSAWAELARAMAREPDLAAWVLGTPHDGLHLSLIDTTNPDPDASEVFCESLMQQLGYSAQHEASHGSNVQRLVNQDLLTSMKESPSHQDNDACNKPLIAYYHRNGDVIMFKRDERRIHNAEGETSAILAKLTRCNSPGKHRTDEQTIQTECQTLKTALQKSQQKLLDFTSVASHDLQAPLRHINGMVQLLLIHNEDVLNEKGKQLIHRTIQSIETLQHLIDDLLTYTQVESRPINLEPLPIHKVCGEAIELLSAPIEESRASIYCEYLPTVQADRSMLIHLMQNLIANGIKFCGDTEPSIVIRSEEHPDHWTINVEDNGIGIDPNQHQKIFQSFTRLHNPSTYSGSGLGLSICKTIIERHGGTIGVESLRKQGSRFYFNIPKRASDLC